MLCLARLCGCEMGEGKGAVSDLSFLFFSREFFFLVSGNTDFLSIHSIPFHAHPRFSFSLSQSQPPSAPPHPGAGAKNPAHICPTPFFPGVIRVYGSGVARNNGL